MLKVITHTITHAPIAALWRGFLAGAATFNAELPATLSYSKLPDDADFARALPIVLVAIGNAAAVRDVDANEVVPAGFEIAVDPCRATITFGSGRSAIALVLSRGESRIDIGLRFADEELEDAAGARESARQRHEAAFGAIFPPAAAAA